MTLFGRTYDFIWFDELYKFDSYVKPDNLQEEPVPPSNLLLKLLDKQNEQKLPKPKQTAKAKPFPSSRKRWQNS